MKKLKDKVLKPIKKCKCGKTVDINKATRREVSTLGEWIVCPECGSCLLFPYFEEITILTSRDDELKKNTNLN